MRLFFFENIVSLVQLCKTHEQSVCILITLKCAVCHILLSFERYDALCVFCPRCFRALLLSVSVIQYVFADCCNSIYYSCFKIRFGCKAWLHLWYIKSLLDVKGCKLLQILLQHMFHNKSPIETLLVIFPSL